MALKKTLNPKALYDKPWVVLLACCFCAALLVLVNSAFHAYLCCLSCQSLPFMLSNSCLPILPFIPSTPASHLLFLPLMPSNSGFHAFQFHLSCLPILPSGPANPAFPSCLLSLPVLPVVPSNPAFPSCLVGLPILPFPGVGGSQSCLLRLPNLPFHLPFVPSNSAYCYSRTQLGGPMSAWQQRRTEK